VKPVEVFRYLQEKSLPMVISFPMVEEKNHLVTGRGVCYVEEVHGTSRMTLSRFNPFRLVKQIARTEHIYATFEVNGRSQECVIRDLTISGNRIVAAIPEAMTVARRRFIRIEPSLGNPVFLFIKFPGSGTHTFVVRDVCEQGCGFLSKADLHESERILCGIKLPEYENEFILSEGKIVYKKREGRSIRYGLELYLHHDDVARMRQYIMKREIEIRKLLQEY